jgi:uncharacterized membrane protein
MTTTPSRAHRVPLLLSLQVPLFFATGEAKACPDCATAQSVWSQVVANRPGFTLAILTLAFCAVAGLIVLSARLMHRFRLLFGGALLLGAGLGAFLDGITLHQVLQWHAMISSVVVPVDLVSSKVNMFWDGVFHLYSWLATLAAIVIVVREVPKAAPEVRARAVGGGALAGWGFFNLVEGVIDHQIFGLHHVHPGVDELAWDIGFIASGVVLIAVGFVIAVPVLRRRVTASRAPAV